MATRRFVWTIVPILLIAAAVPLRAPAQDRPAASDDPVEGRPTLQQTVAQLIADLDADSREVRTAAQWELLRLGPAALAHLPPPELLPDSAVRATVRRIRLALEEQQARASVQPSRISLAGDVPLGEAVAQLARQSGNALDASALPEALMKQRVQLDFRETPFWTALDRLAAQAGLTWSLDRAADGLRLAPRAGDDRTDDGRADELAVDGAGVYRVAVASAGLRPIAGRADERLLRMTVRLTAEPRLRPLFFAFVGEDLEATAGGRALAPFSPDARKEIPFGEGGKDVRVTWDFVVPARTPADTPLGAVSLAAKGTVLTAAGSEQIVFSDLSSAGVVRRRGGVTVALEDIVFRPSRDGAADEGGPENNARPDGQTAHLRVAVSYDTGGPAFESHRTWIFHNRAWLETRDGRRTAFDGFTTDLERDGAVAVEYHFDHLPGTAGDYRFVYEAPTLLINVPVEVNLSGIAVPRSDAAGGTRP